jgi:hypothetical protein
MNGMRVSIWKRAVVDLPTYTALEGLRNITESLRKIAGVPAEIRTEHFPNKSLERYH